MHSKRILLYLQRTVATILILFPAFFLTLTQGRSASVYLLVLCGLTGIVCRIEPMGKSFFRLLKEVWPLHLAMGTLLMAMLINHALGGRFPNNAYEMALQLACFPILLWIALLPPANILKHMQWGFVVGAVSCAIAFYIETNGGTERPGIIFDVPLIPFTHIAVLMGVLAVLSLGWNVGHSSVALPCKMAAGVAALCSSYLSQTRSSWILLPFFVVLVLTVFWKRRYLRWQPALLLAVVVILGGIFAMSDTVRKRGAEVHSDVLHYVSNENKNTSIGVRLQLWHGSWILFTENPVFGIGRERYLEAMQQLVVRRILSPEAASHPHPHNDLLYHMTTLGIFGLLAMLSLYFVPAFYFFRDIHSPDQETRSIAGMGLALTLGFFAFGLTDVMFYWRVSYIFYVVLLVALFACLLKRKAALQN